MTLKLNDKTLLTSKNYSNGQWIDSDDGASLEVINPADGKLFAHVACCGSSETNRMISAAHEAQKKWSQSLVKERAYMLGNWFRLVMENKEDLARILTQEQGNRSRS